MKNVLLSLIILFTLKVNAQQFQVLHNFSDSLGRGPSGNLVSDGTYLYGSTIEGGPGGNQGTIFKIKPNGSGFDTLISFNMLSLGNPTGSLI